MLDRTVGDSEGDDEDCIVGEADGRMLGVSVGADDGVVVGFPEGVATGNKEGATDGRADGATKSGLNKSSELPLFMVRSPSSPVIAFLFFCSELYFFSWLCGCFLYKFNLEVVGSPDERLDSIVEMLTSSKFCLLSGIRIVDENAHLKLRTRQNRGYICL